MTTLGPSSVDKNQQTSEEDDDCLNFMNMVKLDASDEPAVMVVAAEEPSVGTQSPTEVRGVRDNDDNEGKKKRVANKDALGIGLADDATVDGEQLAKAKMNEIVLLGGDLPGQRRRSSELKKELTSNPMANSINTLVSIFLPLT
jgi:hypothetical protein